MGCDGPAITLDVVIDDAGHTGPGRVSVLRLTWRPSDALAVALQLFASPDHPALARGSWVVLRDFLRYGLDEPTGDGAVRISPDLLRDRVSFDLQRLGRPTTLSVPRPLLREFLDRTQALVPAGEERSAQALEELLARLLRASP